MRYATKPTTQSQTSISDPIKTLYIFLGVAACVGLVAGSILYVSSSVLISVLNLNPVPEQQGRTAASVRAAREKKKLEQAWRDPAIKSKDGAWKSDGSMEKKYVEWLGKGSKGPTREETILEEDDDSEYWQ